MALARKKLGMRYLMSVVGLDAGARGGARLARPAARTTRPTRPVLLCSDPSAARERVAATEVKDLLLELAGLRPAGAS